MVNVGQSISSSGQTKMKLGIYVLFLAVYLSTAPGHFKNAEGAVSYETTQNLVEHQSLHVTHFKGADTPLGKDGKPYAASGLGQSIAAVPLYLAGKAEHALAPHAVDQYFAGRTIEGGLLGGSSTIFFVSLFNQVVAPLTCVVFYLVLLRLGFTLRDSLVATLAYGLGTMAWTGSHDSFHDPLETLMLLSCVYVLYSRRQALRPVDALLAGTLLGYGALARTNVIGVMPAFVGYFLWLRAGDLRAISGYIRSAGPSERGLWMCFVAPLIASLGVLLLLNYVRYGGLFEFNPNVQEQGFTLQSIPTSLYAQLLSPGRSVFLYSPPLAGAIFCIGRFRREHPAEGALVITVTVTYFAIYCTYAAWSQSWNWGPRYLEPAVTFLLLPVAYMLERRSSAVWLALLAALGIGIQLLGVLVDYRYVYSLQWLAKGYLANDAYLYIPRISPIPTHLRDLLAGRYVDFWLEHVMHDHGALVFAITAAVPVGLLSVALWLFNAARIRRPAAHPKPGGGS
jgi:hypothetical protein